MGMSLNKVILIGHLTKDPEVKYTKSGKAFVRLGVATNRSYKKADGEYEDIAEFHNVTIWEKQAEYIGKYAQKGSLLSVDGRLSYNEWTDKKGNKRVDAEVGFARVNILAKKREEPVELEAKEETPDEPTDGVVEGEEVNQVNVDDIPF